MSINNARSCQLYPPCCEQLVEKDKDEGFVCV